MTLREDEAKELQVFQARACLGPEGLYDACKADRLIALLRQRLVEEREAVRELRAGIAHLLNSKVLVEKAEEAKVADNMRAQKVRTFHFSRALCADCGGEGCAICFYKGEETDGQLRARISNHVLPEEVFSKDKDE